MLFMEPILVLITIYLSLVYGLLFLRGYILSLDGHLPLILLDSFPGVPYYLRFQKRAQHQGRRSLVHWCWYRHDSWGFHQSFLYAALSCAYREVERVPPCRGEALWCNGWRPLPRHWRILARMDWGVREYTLVCSCPRYRPHWDGHKLDLHVIYGTFR